MKIPTILKGDDSGIIELTMAEGRSYEGATLVVAYQGVTRQFTDLVAGQKVNLAFTHDETAGFKLGCKPLLMRLIGPLGAVETVENAAMRIKVTDCLGELNAGGSFLVEPGATAVPVTDVGDVGERYTLADLHAKINSVIHVLAQRSLLSLAVLLAGAAFGASARIVTLYNDDLVVTNVDDIAAAASTAQQTASAAQTAATNAQQTADEATRLVGALADEKRGKTDMDVYEIRNMYTARDTPAEIDINVWGVVWNGSTVSFWCDIGRLTHITGEANSSVETGDFECSITIGDAGSMPSDPSWHAETVWGPVSQWPFGPVSSRVSTTGDRLATTNDISGKLDKTGGTVSGILVVSNDSSVVEIRNGGIRLVPPDEHYSEGFIEVLYGDSVNGVMISPHLVVPDWEDIRKFEVGSAVPLPEYLSERESKREAAITNLVDSLVAVVPAHWDVTLPDMSGAYTARVDDVFYDEYDGFSFTITVVKGGSESQYDVMTFEDDRNKAHIEVTWLIDGANQRVIFDWMQLRNRYGLATTNDMAAVSAAVAQIGEVAARAVTQPEGSAEPDDYRVQIGHGATATGPAGAGADSAGRNQSIAIGYNATATNWTSVAIGSGGWSELTNAQGVVTGRVTNAATADGREAVAIGYGSKAHGNMSTAVGKLAQAHGDYSAAFGAQTSAGQHGVAIGFGADASRTRQKGIAIGRYANVDAENAVQLFTGTNTTANSIKIGDTFVWRSGHPANEDDPHFKTFTNSLFKTDPVRFNVAIGQGAAVLTTKETTNNTSSVAIGRSARVEPTYGDAQASVAIGMQAKSANISAITIGHSSSNYGKRSVAIGRDVVISNDFEQAYMDAIAIGYQAQAYRQQGIAVGKTAVVNGSGAVQIGTGTNSEANSLKFRSTTVVGGDGKIPSASLGMTTLTVGGTNYTVGTATISGHTVMTLTPAP